MNTEHCGLSDLAHDVVDSWVFAELELHFGVPVVDSEDLWPRRPWVVLGALFRGTRHNLERSYRSCTLTTTRTEPQRYCD